MNRGIICPALVVAFLAAHSSFLTLSAPAQVITTVAGAPWSFQGDGKPAINAPLGQVSSALVDSSGNVYVSDPNNNRVMKISPSGTLTVVAGNGLCGLSGNDGPATAAALCSPYGLALDATGNLLVVERYANRIRKVSPAGIISLFAGTGTAGFSGDGGPATGANLRQPMGIALDSAGNLYIAEYYNARVRKVSASGVITTFAGTGASGMGGDGGPATAAKVSPTGLATDSAGNVYIADYGNRVVRRVDRNGVISTFAGGGASTPSNVPATSAALRSPSDVKLDAAGNVLIVDSGLNQVFRVNAAGIITIVAGNLVRDFVGDGGPAANASFAFVDSLEIIPSCLATDGAGNLYICDTFNSRLRRVNSAGIITTVAGNGSYKFSGDGGSARSANLSNPHGVIKDTAGNLYVVDTINNRIRKIATDGTISTIAGTGFYGYAGDGGPAIAARMALPTAIAFDRQGNLLVADFFNHAIRSISPSGVITTLAGAPSRQGLAGDGGPAVNASLNFPIGVSADGGGNVYIADANNHRIRKVNAAGIITTVAGSTPGFSGDGGPATSASLQGPQSAIADAAGNLYIGDTFNQRIRKVTAAGIISTIGGTGANAFSGDGGPAVAAAFSLPTQLQFDSAGNLYVLDFGPSRIRVIAANGIVTTVAGGGGSGDGVLATNANIPAPAGFFLDGAGNLYVTDNQDRIRQVLAAPPTFSAAPASVSFTGPAGVPGVLTQQISLASAVQGLSWTATAATQSGGNWLSLASASGTIPANLAASVNAPTLSPGTYQGTITITVALANPSTISVPVTLTVTAATPANLQVQPSALSFQVQSGAAASSQSLSIGNNGGAALAWTATTTTTSGGNWLSLSAASGTSSPGSTQSIQVSANPAGLAAGVYSGSVTVSSASQTVIVPVTLSLLGQNQTILVSQSGLLFTGVAGGTVLPPQTIGILNTGQGTMSWTVSASTRTSAGWLSVTPASGTSEANSLTVPLVQVNVNTAGLSAGQYSGLIQVASSGANNSPQFVTVTLNVLPAGSNPGVTVRPTGLIFTARAGGGDPGSQTVQLGAAGTASVDYLSGVLTFGGNWLQILPGNGSFSATRGVSILAQPTLQPSGGALAAGIYSGSLTLGFSDRSPTQVVEVLFVVVPPASVAAQGMSPSDTAGCTPKKLLAVSRALSNSFSSPAGWPASLEVQVTDDCGNAVSNATVVASFSNGDPALALAGLGNGLYTGTWRPLNVGAQVVVSVRAVLPSLEVAQLRLQGQVGTNLNVPAVFAGGVVNGASFAKGDAVAPGSIVSVFGTSMAQTTGGASSLPLPTTLSGASLTIGGVAAPLFYSSTGQVNAQIPFELAPNSRPQLVLGTPNAYAVPETITIADVRPGIFTTDSSGAGQGAVTNPAGTIVDSRSPVIAGDVVVVYCSGLGATNPSVPTGSPAPGAEPLARALRIPAATVDGKTAAVQFGVLVAGFVGLYQVNVQIPAGVTPGSAVPLVILQSGVPSNTVTLAIR